VPGNHHASTGPLPLRFSGADRSQPTIVAVSASVACSHPTYTSPQQPAPPQQIERPACCSACGCRSRARRCTGRSSGGQEAFFKGHTRAFRVLGGVPFGKIRRGNLKAAVAKVLGFRSHCGLEAFYCQPGLTVLTKRAGSWARSASSAATRLSPTPRWSRWLHGACTQ
jgi:hypothetical protein